MTAKQQAIKALNNLARSIQTIERPAFQAKHKEWLATEIQSFSLVHGIKLQSVGYNPPGEGVSTVPAAGNLNQFPLPSKNSQCDNNLGNTVRYITGITTLYSDGSAIHEARSVPGGQIKAVGASISSGEGQESSRVEIEAPGAREGGVVVPGDLGEKVHRMELNNRMGGETAEEFTARQHQEAPLTVVVPTPGQVITATTVTPPVWPKEARVSVLGPTLNPRLCSGALIEEGDRLGRKVSVWKGRHFLKTGSILKCRLDLVQGDDARYLPI